MKVQYRPEWTVQVHISCNLTNLRWYDVIEISHSGEYYFLKNDTGGYGSYRIDMFIALDEYRQVKLNQLI